MINSSHFIKDYYERFWKKTEIPKDYKYKASLIKKLVPKQPNLNVLDFGCGNGIVIQDMLKINPSLKVIGVDNSQIAIASARKKISGQKFYIVEDGKRLPFKDNSFDFIFVLDVLQYISNTEFIFKELSRVLKSEGRLLITLPYYGILKNIVISLIGFEIVYNPRNPEIRFYTPNSLMKEIKAVGLSPIKLGYFGRLYPFSNGMYCISQK